MRSGNHGAETDGAEMFALGSRARGGATCLGALVLVTSRPLAARDCSLLEVQFFSNDQVWTS
jgi:hypothetical protein